MAQTAETATIPASVKPEFSLVEDSPNARPGEDAPWSENERYHQWEMAEDNIQTLQAICSKQISAEKRRANPDQSLIDLWEKEEDRLEDESERMDPEFPEGEAFIRYVLDTYDPVIRAYDQIPPSLWDGSPPFWNGLEDWKKRAEAETEACESPCP